MMGYGHILHILLVLLRGCVLNMAWTTSLFEILPTTSEEPYSLPDGTLQCPYVSTCIYEHVSSLTGAADTTHRPCCTPCTSDDVTKMKCCPDIAPCTLPAATPSDEQKICVPSTFKRTFYQIYILATATCKQGSDEIEKAMCLQEYDADNVGPLDILPVTDVNEFETYRNVHCAICNGLQKEHVKFWSLRVTCETTSNIDMTKYSDIVKVIDNTSACHISYDSPYQDTRVVYCSPVIASCNVTGANTRYNNERCAGRPALQRLYQEYRTMIFKNGGCLECNGYVLGHLWPERPAFPALSTVLDYRSLADPDVLPNTCRSGTVLFPQKGECLEVRCSLVRRLQGNICAKTIPLVDSFSYKLVFRFKVEADIDVGTGSTQVTPIGQMLDTMLRQVFMKISDAAYEVLLVADTNMTVNDTPSAVDIMDAKLFAIEIRAKLKNSEMHDPDEKLNTLLHLTADKTFVTVVDQTLFTSSMILKDDTEVDFTPDFSYMECNNRFRAFENCLGSDSLTDTRVVKIAGGHTALVYYGKIDDAVKSKFVLRPISTERNILEFRDCLFVRVLNRDTHWTEGDIGLLFSSSGMFLSYSEFLYGENDGEIWICMDVYDALHASSDTLAAVLLYQLVLVIMFTA